MTNLLCAKAGSPLAALVEYLRRIEDLAYCRVWTKSIISRPGQKCSIDVVELPRLNLKFALRNGRLFSNDHIGMFVSNRRYENISRLIRGLPHSIVLENIEGELGWLVRTRARCQGREGH